MVFRRRLSARNGTVKKGCEMVRLDQVHHGHARRDRVVRMPHSWYCHRAISRRMLLGHARHTNINAGQVGRGLGADRRRRRTGWRGVLQHEPEQVLVGGESVSTASAGRCGARRRNHSRPWRRSAPRRWRDRRREPAPPRVPVVAVRNAHRRPLRRGNAERADAARAADQQRDARMRARARSLAVRLAIRQPLMIM